MWNLVKKYKKSHTNKFHSVQCFFFLPQETRCVSIYFSILELASSFRRAIFSFSSTKSRTLSSLRNAPWPAGADSTDPEGHSWWKRWWRHLLQGCRSAEKIYINISIFCNKSVPTMWRRRENDEKLRELLVVNINYEHRRKMACGWEGKCNLASEHEAWRVLCWLSIWKCRRSREFQYF